MESVRRALLAGKIRTSGPRYYENALLVSGYSLDRESRRRIAAVGDQIDAVLIDPSPHDAGGNVGLVLVVGGDDLDLLAEHGRTKILDRQSCRLDRAFAAEVRVQSRHVVDHADADDIAGYLRQRLVRRD